LQKVPIIRWDELSLRIPAKANVEAVDLLIVRYGDDEVAVLSGRCPHKGALLANGTLLGNKIICGWHGWTFRYDTGEAGQACADLKKFSAWVDDGYLWVDAEQIRCWRDQYQAINR